MTENRINRISKILFYAILATICINASAQTANSLAYLQETFPKLTKLYSKELSECHTHYIFAVDVSGSMVKYDEIVTPALQAFAQALPAGEQVSVIPFGTEAKENTPGLCTKIEGDAQKQVLYNALSTLYKNDGYTPEFKRNTDVNKAVEAINKTILNNQEVQMNVVVIITDFLNDLPGKGEQKLASADLEKLSKDFNNVTDNTYTRVVAMQLPKAGTGAGFCLDQLQSDVFNNTSITRKFDIIQAINDRTAISHWFDQLSRDIMTEKLRAVIQLDNQRNLRPTFTTDIDIDGNTTAEIHWKPNKLYQSIKLDTVYTDAGSDYIFYNGEAIPTVIQDTAVVLDLGKLKHKNWGLRRYNENLNLGLSTPTDYDDELKRLSIDKPIQATSDQKSGWLFTFILPFWLTVALLALLIIYLFLVMKAIARNNKERFIGTVDFTDHRGRVINGGGMVKVGPSKTLNIGQAGNYGCDLPGVQWNIKVSKKKPSPFLPWKRPSFEWVGTSGYVRDGRRRKRGLLGRYGKSGTSKIVNLECGSDDSHITENVKIRIK
ncbi:MAG: VWA domain-containing protein [Bacteroides sp.]|nr:VWA domain-containing protein [Bacteroides sp.]MCM1413069.1 VWA domain-containing protein [Bacteroides sp.]MCM1471775.1 VWA domain-containing protein [Bacteroides sp.]